MTSALDGGEWSASRPGCALLPGKGPPVPIVQEAEWAPEPVWTKKLQEKSFLLCRGSNLDRPVVQPVADTILTEVHGSRNISLIRRNTACCPHTFELNIVNILPIVAEIAVGRPYLSYLSS
jgi:hypothetical protein